MADNIYSLSDWLEQNKDRALVHAAACFTGHRPKDLYGYAGEAAYEPIVAETAKLCTALSDALGIGRFISGGAQGFDQLAFWAVNRLRLHGRPDIQNAVYVPFSAQPSRWRADGLFGQANYRTMLRRATSVSILADDPQTTAGAVQALHGRNHRMVEDSDIVIAMLAPKAWDFSSASGGTAECVRYARSAGRPVVGIRIDPRQRRILDTIVIDN